jgi:hypothetical protein
MSWPEDRKLVELKRKLASIQQDFARWQAATSAGADLPKHNSQVLRVTQQLGTLTQEIATQLAALEQDPARLLAESRPLEMMILDVHRIWDFFRSKLAQRYVEEFRAYLVVADEFAWACYTAAREAADPALIPPDDVKEPPLIYLNSGWSPFTITRGADYTDELAPGDEIVRQQFQEILQALPLSIIGMPWYQIQHLPDVVAIGHEVGHSVEDDFRLTEGIEALVEAALDACSAPEERRSAWRCWAGELFADLYGILAGGPAYVSGLMDFLVLAPAEIMDARQQGPYWTGYPTDALRIVANLHALDYLGITDAASRLRTVWTSRFPRHAMTEFEPDARAVVEQLLSGAYQNLAGKALKDVISFGTVEAAQADDVRKSLRQSKAPAQPIRPTVAGTRLAFEADPAGFVTSGADTRVLKAVSAAQTGAVRGPKEVAPLQPHDVAAGRALFERLKKLRG